MRTCLKNVYGFNLLALVAHLGFLVNCRADELPIGHFTSTNYGEWKVTGTAFNKGPVSDGLLPKLELKTLATIEWPAARLKGTGQ